MNTVGGTVKSHWDADPQLQNIPVTKNGYIYVYCSNESPVNVFFDNLQVTHERSALLEETHYYPFGLTMAGISSKSAGGLENKIKYNGKELQSKEFSDGSGLELYDYGARLQDPQLGRWWTQDKFAEVYVALTPYHYAANNPVKIVDEAGHLLRDGTKQNNIIATSTGNIYTRTSDVTGTDGNTYRVNGTFKEVVVYTDKGTPITALQMVSQYVQQQSTDAQGNTIYTPATNAPINVDGSQNCHGNTFADGKLVIIASEGNINTILKEDGYTSKGVTMENADAFTMSYGFPYHSGKVKNREFNSDHDLEKPQSTTMEKEKEHTGYQPDGTTTLYDRKGTDKQVSTKVGKAANGIRTMTQQQATDLRKKNGLNTSNKAKGKLNDSPYKLEGQ